MISAGDGDLAEVVFGHARLMHVAAHDERNFTIRSHHAERHLVVARVGRCAAMTAALAKGRGRRNNQTRTQSPGLIPPAAWPNSDTEPSPPLPPAKETPGVMPRIAATSSGQKGCE